MLGLSNVGNVNVIRILLTVVVCLSWLAFPATSHAKGLGVLDVPQGRSVSLALTGNDYRAIDGVVAVRTIKDRPMQARGIRARLSAADRSGKRWLMIDVARDASLASYRLEGTRRGKPVLVVPAVLRVVSARVSAQLPTPMRAAQRKDFPTAGEATVELATATVYAGQPLAANVSGARSVSKELARPSPATVSVVAEMEADIRRASGEPWSHSSGRGPRASASGTTPPPRNTGSGGSATSAPLFDSFNGTTTGVSWLQAYQLSLLSWLAYFPGSDIPAIAAAWGLSVSPGDIWDITTPPLWLSSGSSQGFIATSDNAIFVVFRGSTTGAAGQDWWDNNLDVRPRVIPAWGAGVVMHQGFTEATEVAYPFVTSRLALHLAQSNRKVWITGHSLGGAMATITAFRLKQENVLTPHRLVTFGAPKVGNDYWRQAFEAKGISTQRWNREGDPAPTILPSGLFSHVGDDYNIYQSSPNPTGTFGWNEGAPPDLPLDLNVAIDRHMDYWCRLYDEAVADGVSGSLMPPPSNDTPGCMD